MKLREVLKGTGLAAPDGRDPEITGLTNDSREAGRGALFFALPGSRTDGALYARAALEKGAVAVISAAPLPAELRLAFPAAACLACGDLPAALSAAAVNFYGDPSLGLRVYGLTGTKGKTTTAYLLESALTSAGRRPGVIGTIDYRVDGRVLAQAANTTPLAHTLQSLLARFRAEGAASAVLEISSHALALRRADAVKFDCAVFTNLQSDHLDFHKDREEYFRAKARLFDLLAASPKKDRLAAVNADDERAPALLAAVKGKVRAVTFGVGTAAEFRAEDLRLQAGETLFTLVAGGRRLPLRLALLGRHNVYNALAAIAAASLELPLEEAAAGVTALRNVPGRLERVEAGQDFTVFVDYAHTEAALVNVLESLRLLPHGKIITVFGCGGDRDATKRAPMGRAACALSDRVVITSDNPRREDPARIIADIERGVAGTYANYETEPDRAAAIARAVGLARPGDIVLIAGKGHENYQLLADRTVPFSDAETAAAEIRKLA